MSKKPAPRQIKQRRRAVAQGSRPPAKAIGGVTIEWQAEITLDRPAKALAWRSVDDTVVPHRGIVRFAPGAGGRGTEVQVELTYEPRGDAAATLAELFGGEPARQVAADLFRLKELLERQPVQVA